LCHAAKLADCDAAHQCILLRSKSAMVLFGVISVTGGHREALAQAATAIYESISIKLLGRKE
jgi:hypothetical protein